MQPTDSGPPESPDIRPTPTEIALETVHVPYAPMVWRDNPWWQYARRAAKAGLVMADGRIDPALPDMIEKDIANPYLENVAKFSREEGGVDSNFGMKVLSIAKTYRHWIPMLGQHELQGRQIFQLSEGLLET